ncbi:MAG: hypothetical protein SWN10_21035 [Pseudomonadota bacterium]|nr:hypothetical protein [Pseudomonadota bacterium]
MSLSCKSCTAGGRQEQFELISEMPDSKIFVCAACGAYWQQFRQRWELLLPGLESHDYQESVGFPPLPYL